MKTVFFCLLVTGVNICAGGQVRNYKSNDIVNVGGDEQIKIVRCTGEGANRQCEVVYLIKNKQVGNSFWLTATAIQNKERLIKKNGIARPVVKTNSKVSKSRPSATVQKAAIPGKTKPVNNDLEVNPPARVNNFAQKLNQAIGNHPPPSKDSVTKIEVKKLDTIIQQASEIDSLKEPDKVFDTIKTVVAVEDSLAKKVTGMETQPKKLGVFIDCATCDMTYMRSELRIVDFLLNNNAADVHLLISEQQNGGGGNAIQIIFYGQHKFKAIVDTIDINVPPNFTGFEKRSEVFKAIQIGLVPFINKTQYAKYLNVNIIDPEKKNTQSLVTTKDPWNYWVFQLGGSGSLNSDQVYESTEASGYVTVGRTTNKLKVNFSGSANYNNYKYSYSDSFTSYDYEILNRDYLFEHSIIGSLGSHWGIGYQVAYSRSTFSNNKNRLYGKAAIEYSIFPYKDVNTRFFTLSYGVNIRANEYYDSTIYFKTEEKLLGQVARADMSFNQKWGTLSGSLAYSSFFKDPSLNNLSASLKFYIRITGGLSFNIYAYGARVRDEVYLVKGSASVQDVLTRRRQLASEYDFGSGVGLDLRFGSKLNNFVNPRLKSL